MRTVATLVLVMSAAVGSATSAGAQSVYEISVELDATTSGDADLVAGALENAPVGIAPQSLRKLAAGVVGEFAVLANQRITAEDVLTLDGGGQVALVEGDTLRIRKRTCRSYPCPGAEIQPRKGSNRPLAIRIYDGNGVCTRVINLGKTSSGHPEVQSCSK